MKIAVTYENGEVYQHFGHSESFKVYEVENGAVVSAEVIGTNGGGHGALAGLLSEKDVKVLICGGIGAGAQSALAACEIDVISGVSGSADDAVSAYLKGELVSAGVNCDHHSGESDGEEGCGGDCGSGCGGGCGGCGGRRQPVMEGPNAGKNVKVHYVGTLNDGTKFDSSVDRGEPLAFVCGVGMMIKGFDAAVVNMEVGQSVEVHLSPEEAYGMPDPNAIFTIEIAQLPGSEELTVGEQVYLSNQFGQPFPVKVTAKDDTMITLDANHELAGKELNFAITLLEVE